MALLSSSSSRSDAVAQYQDNLAYWESETKAANLLEAVLFLLQEDFQSMSVAGRSITRQSLETLRDRLIERVEAQSDATRVHFVRAIPVNPRRTGT